MAKNRLIVETPKDYVWKILGKLSLLTDEYSYTDYARTCYTKITSIVRARNFSQYINFCKRDVSLRRLNKEYPCSYIVGERTLREIRALRLLTIFQKYSFIESEHDREKTALMKFLKTEDECREFNLSTKIFSDEYTEESPFQDLFIFPLIKKMKTIIRNVCGPFNMPQILSQRRNGPGATTSCRGDRATEGSKSSYPRSVSRSCLNFCGPHLHPVYNSAMEGREDGLCDLSNRNSHDFTNMGTKRQFYSVDDTGSSLSFVPKDVEVDRTISIEPTLNVAIQLGCDHVLRRKLKRRLGIDLQYQTHNQELARLGSITGKLVTIDLAAASDSISLKLLDLFPLEWAEFFFCTRSHRWSHKEYGTRPFHKVSSMGNGYTFLLETLIFAAACKAVYSTLKIPWTKDNISIYGDDLVVHQDAYTWIRILLKHLGFRVNAEKTFSSGPIRESCGHDYYNGHRIDRFTCKDNIDLPLTKVILHNSLFLFFREYKFTSTYCEEILDYLKKYIPKNFYHFGPVIPEDKVAWLFSEEPPQGTKPFYHRDYQDWYFRIKRNEKYHPSQSAKVKKSVMTTSLFYDSELPCAIWKEIRYNVPLPWVRDVSATFFRTEASKNVGGSSLVGSVINIPGHTDLFSSMFFQKSIDVVRQTTHLLALRHWVLARQE